MLELTRRQFLKATGATGATLAAGGLALRLLQPAGARGQASVVSVDNPLDSYPDRNWEKVYHDQYSYDSSYTWVCSPNDTHCCRIRSFVRNGVAVRQEQIYNYQAYGDLYGNKATVNWNPRMCLKGYTMHRRVYGPYRLKGPLVRKGWKQWADDGFPDLDQEDNRSKYKFDSRGTDEFVSLSWDETFEYMARGFVAIANRYSGPEGEKRLLDQGYPPEMIEPMRDPKGNVAGTRTFKFRGGMGLLGVIGKYGMYRISNMMALLDAHVRGVSPEDAMGGRNWSNYTWHGDQAPGHPWVHGLQTSDTDFNDLRATKLHIQVGKNLIENKMPDSHWFVETMERGAKIVVIAPEYNPPATKADYWIPCRPGLGDTAIFLGITKILMDEKKYDEDYVKQFTDFPLLVRTDTLVRLRAHEVFEHWKPGLSKDRASFTRQGLKEEQYYQGDGEFDRRKQISDYVVFDARSRELKAMTRDDVGEVMTAKGMDPALELPGGKMRVRLVDGTRVEVMTVWDMYKVHLQDYDLDTVAEISQSPKELIRRLAEDIATIKPAAIHYGEGINHWFHATLHNRATYLPLMLTGNIGIKGGGSHTWAGNYKAANFQGSPWTGPGFKGWVGENPFEPNLDPNAHGKDIQARGYFKDEEPAYWNHGDRPLIVETPKAGRKVFTGWTAMPTPTKVLWFNNVNLFNNAKHAYDMFFNVNPGIELIASADIEMTSSCEYSDFVLAANSWMEFQQPEITSSCSNPFLEIWGRNPDGIKPLYDTLDDVVIMARFAKALGDEVGDSRFADYWKFALEGQPEVYIQRLLDSCTTTAGYTYDDIMAGKYGEPGAALMLFRTYPRIPFYEQVKYSEPFFTDHGRMQAYSDVPEAIEYGENFIVHREGPEATPYLPNVIVSTNPYIRPDDYGIPPDAQHWDERTVRNIKMSWEDVKKTLNFLWEKGYNFYCVTPKTRHRVHSQWSVCDWNLIWDSNFGDPYRMDRRTPGVGEHQLHINPETARALGIDDGDYIYVDANPADRPYRGWKPDDPRYKVARLMLRAKYNPAYPYNMTMMKHAPYVATERTVKAHEARPDGRALSEDTGYQANFRYGSQQSITRDWSMPMHQTDTLFHKKKVFTAFMFGVEADNHAVNTVPKETLVKITKAEDGGLGGKGVWEPATTGHSPGNENEFTKRYLAGDLVRVKT
ncbi:MAG: molybdopterin-dependent oxidoreductase [Anaerolineae bacterium]